MKIVSLLPTATEIIYALGLGNQLVGVSHECNYPRAVTRLPRVSETEIDYTNISSREINSHVIQILRTGKSLYRLNKAMLEKLQPTHIVTQELCEVCAITPNDVLTAIKNLPNKPKILTLNATKLNEILLEISLIGQISSKEIQAKKLIKTLRTKIIRLKNQTSGLNKKTVCCIEWIEPLFASGHWVPEMVEIAGGKEIVGLAGTRSRKISWETVRYLDPEFLIFMPCGYSFERTKQDIPVLFHYPFWNQLQAVKKRNLWLVNGPDYFNQSGPRVIEEGIEILAKIIHSDRFGLPSNNEAVHI